jgi:o-succinylbenzoate synthase
VRRATPDPELLERYAVPPERRRWWVERVEACAAYV